MAQSYIYTINDLVKKHGPREVLKLGATRLPGPGEGWRVYADPAGHPFCLCWDE